MSEAIMEAAAAHAAVVTYRGRKTFRPGLRTTGQPRMKTYGIQRS
jgi:hypothetical protein